MLPGLDSRNTEGIFRSGVRCEEERRVRSVSSHIAPSLCRRCAARHDYRSKRGGLRPGGAMCQWHVFGSRSGSPTRKTVCQENYCSYYRFRLCRLNTEACTVFQSDAVRPLSSDLTALNKNIYILFYVNQSDLSVYRGA